LQEPIAIEPSEESLIKSHTRKKSTRGSSLSNLPVETIEYRLSDEERLCDTCKNILTEMKKEIRKEIKIIPAQVSIVEHVTYVYSCRSCDKEGIEGFIKKAKSPDALIKKSMVSPSIMSYILNQKYTNAMPLYRQEQEFKRLGVNLTRQNLSNWTIKGAQLLKPLLTELKAELLSQDILHAKAVTYAINQKEYLTSFLKDGRIQLSNNLAEQSIKMFVIGRKNWLFSNTPNGADSSAIIYSIIQTALANDLKPLYYLEYIFEEIQNSKNQDVRRLLPWSEVIPEKCRNIKTNKENDN
jgi:transposase